MKKIIFMYLFLIYTVIPTVVSAQCDPAKELDTDIGCIPADPAGFTSRLYAIGLGFIGGAALLSIMYGGYLVMSSRGNRDQLMKGRSYIFSAIAGMVLAIIGFALYQIIAVDVIKLPGFN